MRCVVGYPGRVAIEDRPIPEPGNGQVLIRARACGICGSDLHMVRHFEELFDGTDGVRLGHELVGEVAAHGPGTGRVGIGTRVASVPFVTSSGKRTGVGTSRRVDGAFSEYYLLDEANLITVPDHIPDDVVTLAEPLAVGIHAVERGEVAPADATLVIGCGPVGLATIAALRMRGASPIIATDPVASRRDMASELGASHVVDPMIDDEMALLRQLCKDRPPVILECAGVTPLIPKLVERAPQRTRIVVAGLHSTEVTISPVVAMTKEVDLRFAYYYAPEEYAEAIDALTSGAVDLAPLVTARVGLDELADAFDLLGSSNDHIKIVAFPWGATEGRP